MNLPHALDVALGLAHDAAAEVERLKRQPLQKQRKADHSLVTNADQAADRILREGLQRAFPDFAGVTEESGRWGPAEAENVWVIDPIDGTRAFAAGRAGYSVMVGLLHRGQPVLGVVVDPSARQTYSALKGRGAFLAGSPRPLRVSGRREWGEMAVVTSTNFPASLSADLKRTLSGPWLPPINSVGVKVGCLVRQAADLYINAHHVHEWDTCAPQIILEEAGGRITYGDGSPLVYRQVEPYEHAQWTLASNGARHDDAMAVCQGLLSSRP